ncbi:Caldesmon [Acipenser ruthenus]|uniref:Caldesmon n=1 Tax=Acipenser ruthenus TaxID=7906 RepID=A0A444UI58_ACIRT|nr:Caldesmon [Acipenser ruthenus]
MKEEIERRRAEAAEKRQKITEEVSPDGEGKKPFKCVSPRGSSLKTNKEIKHPKPGASDLSVVGEGVRNMKSMWEKGNVFSSPGSPGAPNKETAGLKVGVASRINDWLNKTPDSKTAGGKPADLKPGDVTNKRSLWENKPSSPDKSTTRAKRRPYLHRGSGCGLIYRAISKHNISTLWSQCAKYVPWWALTKKPFLALRNGQIYFQSSDSSRLEAEFIYVGSETGESALSAHYKNYYLCDEGYSSITGLTDALTAD